MNNQKTRELFFSPNFRNFFPQYEGARQYRSSLVIVIDATKDWKDRFRKFVVSTTDEQTALQTTFPHMNPSERFYRIEAYKAGKLGKGYTDLRNAKA
jgi:hypothetical protein